MAAGRLPPAEMNIVYINTAKTKFSSVKGFTYSMKDFSFGESFSFWWNTSLIFDCCVIMCIGSCLGGCGLFIRNKWDDWMVLSGIRKENNDDDYHQVDEAEMNQH